MAVLAEHHITPIDLVVVNLYPFQATVAKPDVTLADAIENIDIGGPTMVRSAAKNHDRVGIIVNPARYSSVVAELKEAGELSLQTKRLVGAGSIPAHCAIRCSHQPLPERCIRCGSTVR